MMIEKTNTKQKLSGLKLFTSILFSLSMMVSFSQKNVSGNWDGKIIYTGYYKKGEQKEFILDFNGDSTGTTYTAWGEGYVSPCPFEIEYLENGMYRLIEQDFLEKTENTCYFDANLKLVTKKDKQHLVGKFTSIYSNGKRCGLQGVMVLSQPYFSDEVVLNQTELTPSQKLSLHNQQINVFPNPTQGDFTIDTKESKFESDKILVKIVDVQGKVVVKEKFKSDLQIKKMNLDFVDNGVYVINIYDGDNLYSQKRISIAK